MFASSLIYILNLRLLHISLNVFCVSDHHLPTALVIQWLSISEILLLSVLIGIHNFPCHSWDCFHNVNIVIILSLLAGISVLGAGLSKVWLESATSVFLLCQHNAYFAGLGPWQLFYQSNISYPGHARNIVSSVIWFNVSEKNWGSDVVYLWPSWPTICYHMFETLDFSFPFSGLHLS